VENIRKQDESGNQEAKKRLNQSGVKIPGFLASRLIVEFTDSRMTRDQFERALSQFLSWRDLVPWRRTRGMRQWNYIKAVSRAFYAKFPTNHFLQFCAVDELHDSQSSDGNDETRVQNSDLIVHP